ncbi:hypothetical protein KKI19_02600 [Patescibacteria group bacterium]|nr:hypothetical protein [Patescibacteria group bacterium]
MEKAPENLYIVIPAGGIGTRLWPRSRQKHPKQFLKLSRNKSITQETVSRLEGFIPYKRIFVVAHDRYKQKLLEQLPKFLPENFISEPERRGTSAAIGLSAMFIRRKNPQGVVHFLVSDDHIENVPRFRRMVEAAAEVADKEKTLVVYGVKPTYPATGYGYIKFKKKIKTIGDIPIFEAEKFVEKPNEATAKKFIATGKYFWHCSGFTSRCDVLLSEMEKKWPSGFKLLTKMDKLVGLPADVEEGEIAKIYHQIENVPIEYSILETATKVMMARQEDTWRDIANWRVVYDISKKDKDGNVIISAGEKGEFVGIEAKNNLVHFDDQLIAVIGVEGLIIVDTGDAVLICNKDKAENVKKMVEYLKKTGRKEYL